MSGRGPWEERIIPDGGWIRQQFGDLTLLVLNGDREWCIAIFRSGEAPDLPESGDARDLPADIDWDRWDHSPEDQRLRFRPVFPPLPIVARPQNSLHLSPNGQGTFYVGIPVWVEIVGECQNRMVELLAVPTQPLSKTWHGTPLAGNLGYSLKTHARRSFAADEWPAHDIICSLDIVNEAPSSLLFERLYLETQHLSVFEKDGRLWANAVRLRVNLEENNLSNMTFAARPAAPFDDAEEVTPPREGRRRQTTIQTAFSRVLSHFNPLETP